MKTGFWVALVLGVLGLADILFSPLFGFLQAAVFFAAAWGIRRGHPWAAMVAGAVVVAPTLAFVMQSVRAGFAPGVGLVVSCVLLGVLAALLARTAVVLFRRRGAGFLVGSDWAAAVFIVLLFTASFSIRPYMMPTGSMANTLLAGDSVLVDVASPALGWKPRRNSLMVFRYPVDPRQTFIKRVIGVPGDRIRMRDKQLFRNGTLVEEPWATHVTPYVDIYRDNFPEGAPPRLHVRAEMMLEQNVSAGELVVPPGRLFVLGDNRDQSLDSRYFGLVPMENLVGRPLLIYSSFVPEKTAAPGRLPSLRQARWDRMFKLL